MERTSLQEAQAARWGRPVSPVRTAWEGVCSEVQALHEEVRLDLSLAFFAQLVFEVLFKALPSTSAKLVSFSAL